MPTPNRSLTLRVEPIPKKKLDSESQATAFFLVPMLCVGTQAWTLRVPEPRPTAAVAGSSNSLVETMPVADGSSLDLESAALLYRKETGLIRRTGRRASARAFPRGAWE